MNQILDLRKKLTEAEAEINTLKRVLRERYQINDDDYEKLKRSERAKHIYDAALYTKEQYIIFKVSQLTGVTVEEIMSRSRKYEIITARFAAYYAVYLHYNRSLSKTGRYFKVHHSTILHGINAFCDRAEFKQNIEYQLLKDIACI